MAIKDTINKVFKDNKKEKELNKRIRIRKTRNSLLFVVRHSLLSTLSGISFKEHTKKHFTDDSGKSQFDSIRKTWSKVNDTGVQVSLYINDTLTNSGSKINMGSNINDSATALVVDDETDFSAGDVILVDAELLYVSAVTSDSSHSLTVTRAYGQSIAAAHLNNAILWKVGLPGKHSASASSRPLIRVDTDQLPFTLSGLMITNLYVLNSGAEGNTDDDVSVLSFH